MNDNQPFDFGRLAETVAIEPHNSSWGLWYAEEIHLLREALRNLGPRFEHIGSSAVAGLRSKPIVDIMIGLDSLELAALTGKNLEAAGYEYFGRLHERQERLFARKRGARSFNLQIVPHLGNEWNQKLIFRDYLRAHPAEVAAYSGIKDEAIASGNRTLLEYHRFKDQLVSELLARAIEWQTRNRLTG